MRKREVVIIDDDGQSLLALEDVLAACGHDPVTFNDPLLAIERVVQSKPDVILLELNMPRKNGFDLMVDINRALEPRKIPCIAMSHFYREDLCWLLDLCGIKKWLKKPLKPLDVIWAIENEIEEVSFWDRENISTDREGVTCGGDFTSLDAVEYE